MKDVLTIDARAANGRITLWLARIAAVALAVIAAVTFCDVIGRYFFHAPFAFTVEMTQMAMALVVYFGVGLVTHESGHIERRCRDAPAAASARASGSGSSPTCWRSALSPSWCGGCGCRRHSSRRRATRQ